MLFCLRIQERLLVLLLTKFEKLIARLSQLVLQIKAHDRQLGLRLGQLLDQLLVRLVFIFDLNHMLERFLEKLDSIDENRLLCLLLDDKVEDFEAEISSRTSG